MKKIIFTLFVTLLLPEISFTLATAQVFRVKPYKVTSSRPFQPRQGPDKSCDNNTATIYLSEWSKTGIPDTLDYYFFQVPNISSIEYTPRHDGATKGRWGEVEIWAATDYPFQFQPLTTVNWQQTQNVKVLSLPGPGVDNPVVIRFIVKSGYGNFSSVAEMAFYSSQPQIDPKPDSFSIEAASVAHLDDLKLPVSSASASNYQANEGISLSFDGKRSTLYHSNHTHKALPYSLVYNFSTADKMDYIVYHPRQDGNRNGIFGRIKVEARTANGNYQTVVENYDCGFKNTSAMIPFSHSFKQPAQVRITVLSGYNNFASIAEIEFYQKREPTDQYLTIFTDRLYSDLRSGITANDINAISDPFFKKLALHLLDKADPKKFRVQHYQAVPSPLKTKTILQNTYEYSCYQNPTGIAFENNAIAIVFVTDYNASKGSVSLKIKDFANETDAKESIYFLKPGLNKFTVTNSGLAYIEYNSDIPDLPDVKINITTGTVNGFLSATSSFQEWQETLLNKAYPKVDLVGKHIGINILKEPLIQNTLFKGPELIQKWDSIIAIQFHQMGLVKYNLVPPNRLFAWIESKGGYYASNHHAHFDLSWNQNALTSPHQLDIWAIANRFGQQNQFPNGLKWTGTFEVTNMIYSAYTSYILSHSRLTRLETTDDLYLGTRLTSNLYNSYYNEVGLKQKNIMSRSNIFERLLPFWQLQLYYSIAGAGMNAPTLEQVIANNNIGGNTDYANWLGIITQSIRNAPYNGKPVSNGQQMMNFVKYASDAVQQDLTDFFIKSGFLIPFDAVVNDYTPGKITITQANIEATKAYIAAKKYPKPRSPVLHYITARNMYMYKNNLNPEGTINTGFTIDNTIAPGKTYYRIAHTVWKNAVAFETITADKKVLFVTTYATGDLTGKTTLVYFPKNAGNIYAVGADGTRLPILSRFQPESVTKTIPDKPNEFEDTYSDTTIKIWPNPARNSFKIAADSTIFKRATMINTKGQPVKQFSLNGTKSISVTNLPIGTYLIVLERNDHSKIIKKIVINRP